MKLSQIESTLREIRVTPVKSLGQNFLHDRNLARWIVSQAALSAADFVVEIGPGLGALTEFALAAGSPVLALEKDARLADFLRERFRDARLEVRHGDALDFDVRQLFAKQNVKLIGNLPYYASSQLLLKFIAYPSPIMLSVLMLQKEMAKRLTAKPRTRDYGALTILVQEHYRVGYLRTVPASVFLPAPDVDSALVCLVPRPVGELPEHDSELLRKLVRLGFSQRRKQLQKLLRAEIPVWERAVEACGVTAQARAEELSLADWIGLSNFVRDAATPVDGSAAPEAFPVVDENDQFVRLAPRPEVHGNNLRHRAVHILLFNARGEVFLQKRSPRKDRHPGVWDSSAAGHVDGHEEYDQTAKRELAEELGVSANLARVAKLPASEQTGQEFIWLYQGHHDGPFHLNRHEIEAGDFFEPKLVDRWIEARRGDFAPGFLECWKLLDRHETGENQPLSPP